MMSKILLSGFIETAHLFTKEHLYTFAFLVSLSMGAMLFAMAWDLVVGIQKARKLGIATTSTGLKKTVDKGRKYFSPFMVLVCIDLIGTVVLPAPFFSMLWAAYCIYCEFKSVREKAWQKSELRKAERTMSVIIENKDDIAKLVAKMLFDAEQGNAEAKVQQVARKPRQKKGKEAKE